MQCKVFVVSVDVIENTINNWLAEQQVEVEIKDITQSESMTDAGAQATIIVWYEE